MMQKKIIKIGKNNYSSDSIKDLLKSSNKINQLIKEKKNSLKNSSSYLQNYNFKKSSPKVEIKNKTSIKNNKVESIKPSLKNPRPKPSIQPSKPQPSKKPKQKVKLPEKPKNKKKTKSVDTYFKKNKKTRKYNKYEIKYIIHSLKKLVDENNFKRIDQLLKKLTREQIIQLLGEYKIISYSTKAPTPLLKNLIFNFILGNIHIIKK